MRKNCRSCEQRCKTVSFLPPQLKYSSCSCLSLAFKLQLSIYSSVAYLAFREGGRRQKRRGVRPQLSSKKIPIFVFALAMCSICKRKTATTVLQLGRWLLSASTVLPRGFRGLKIVEVDLCTFTKKNKNHDTNLHSFIPILIGR